VGSLLPQQIPELVSSGICGKIINYECEWAFCYQFFAAEAPCVLIFFPKSLKLVICDFESKFPLKLKIKDQRLNVK
jgi:hypothetical protein